MIAPARTDSFGVVAAPASVVVQVCLRLSSRPARTAPVCPITTCCLVPTFYARAPTPPLIYMRFRPAPETPPDGRRKNLMSLMSSSNLPILRTAGTGGRKELSAPGGAHVGAGAAAHP